MEREVRQTGKNSDGDITSLCNRGQPWSPRSKRDAINDIKNGHCRYYVTWNGKQVDVRVVSGPTGEYLRTDWDNTNRNNLEDLPAC